MPRRSRTRRGDALTRLHTRVDALSGKRLCTSILSLLVGVLNRCPGPCPRCAGLAKDFEAAAPDRERARLEYEATHPRAKTHIVNTGFED